MEINDKNDVQNMETSAPRHQRSGKKKLAEWTGQVLKEGLYTVQGRDKPHVLPTEHRHVDVYAGAAEWF